jgi:hypothetical protein
MRLLQKDAPFILDATSQHSLKYHKHALNNTLLLHPPNYVKDYILYLVAYASTIAMVLVQENDDRIEHVIYYLSKNLLGLELRYSHVEKLSLAAVISIQSFLHYILLHTTMIIAYSNAMYHILTC